MIDKLRAICENENISLWAFGECEAEGERLRKTTGGGIAIRYPDGEKAIIYDETAESAIAKIVHELGHHVMGHDLSRLTGNKQAIEREEFEARVFAAVFMAMSTYNSYQRAE